MPDIKLGSLFDGIGVFPLAASRCGIRPVWASEIEKAPISITKRHFPDMAHLGDITKVDGGKIPPVHIITFGSPCQNLSLIGNRSGLAGAKSSLFYQAFRIIQEMRDATDNLYPAIAVWENVMGAFSTNDRMDFRAVLSAFSDTEVPMPPSGRWGEDGETPEWCEGERLMCAGGSWTPSIGQAPEGWREGSEFSSWRILEADVPPTYYLSPVQCSHFLRLAERAGGPLPKEIEQLLLKQGGKYQSSTPFSASVCGERQKGRKKPPSETASDYQLTLFPLF